MTWNNTAVPFPDDTTIHALISRVGRRRPPAAPPPSSWSLGCGLATSADLCRARVPCRTGSPITCIALGVGPDTLVGLSVERSLDMVVGILGILKAGAAYLPLDPTYPADRLAFMLEDSGIRVLLTQAGVLPAPAADALGPPSAPCCLDADWPEIAALAERRSRCRR